MRITLLATLTAMAVSGPATAELSLSDMAGSEPPAGQVFNGGAPFDGVRAADPSLRHLDRTGVSVSGDARMGLVYDGEDWDLTNRVRVGLAFDGETDHGLRFGARVRLDEARDAARGVAGSVYVAGDFGTLVLGNVHSADRALVGQLHGVGLTGLGDFNEIDYSAGGGTANGLFGRR